MYAIFYLFVVIPSSVDSFAHCPLSPVICNTGNSQTSLGVRITQCSESYVHYVGPLVGSSVDPITVVGTGFTHEECIVIHVGDKECVIDNMITDGAGVSNITCRIDATMVGTNAERSVDPLPVGPEFEIQV